MAGDTGSGVVPKKKVKTPTSGPVVPMDPRGNGLPRYQQASNAPGFRADGSFRLSHGGGGGNSAGPSLTSFVPASPKAYSWWKPVAYKGSGSTEILASAANALIPSYSDEEAVNIAKWLGENFPDFAAYTNIKASPVSNVSGLRRSMFSKQRAQTALGDLMAMENAAGVPAGGGGTGYEFLKSSIKLLNKYAGEEGGMKRANFDSMMDEFDTMSKSADSSFVELARAFLNPSANGASLMQSFRSNGRTSFGQANARLFV